MKYIVESLVKHGIVEIEFYEKNGLQIKYEKTYKGGEIEVDITDHEASELLKSSVSVDMYKFESDDHLFFDGNSSALVFDNQISRTTKKKLEEIYEENGIIGIEDEGWELVNTECWFIPPLKATKKNN